VPTMFKVVCMSRSRETRAARRLNPVHGGCVQWIGGTHRIVRGRSILFTEEQIRQHLPELRDRQARGLVGVTTLDGRVVSLDEATFLKASPTMPSPPLPEVVLDSISRDDRWGQPMESLPGSLPLGVNEEFKMPAALGVVLEDPVQAVEPAQVEEPSVEELPEEPDAASALVIPDVQSDTAEVQTESKPGKKKRR